MVIEEEEEEEEMRDRVVVGYNSIKYLLIFNYFYFVSNSIDYYRWNIFHR
jgi:hypothetical protein